MSEIYKHKTFDQDFNKVLDYIRKHKDGTLISTSIVQEITDLNHVYARNVFNSIKIDPNIECSLKNKIEAIVKIKEKKVTLKEEIAEKEETPSEKVKMNKRYSNLTAFQVDHIYNVFTKNKIELPNSAMLLSIMNILSSYGASTNYVKDYIEKISDLLILKHRQVRMYVSMLVSLKLVAVVGDGIVFDFSEQEVAILKRREQEAKQEVVTIEPAAEILAEPVSEALVESVPDELEKIEKQLLEPSMKQKETVVIVDTQDNEKSQELYDSISNFSGIIKDFQGYLSSTLKDIVTSSTNTSELEKMKSLIIEKENKNSNLEKELENGNDLITKILEENKELKQSLCQKTEEIRSHKKSIVSYKESMDSLYMNMQERFQILLADINNTISDYTRIPAWKINSSDSARVQKQVIDAITSTVTDLLNFETNSSDKE